MRHIVLMISQEGLPISWPALPGLSKSVMLLFVMKLYEYAWKPAGEAYVQVAAVHHAANENGQLLNAQMNHGVRLDDLKQKKGLACLVQVVQFCAHTPGSHAQLLRREQVVVVHALLSIVGVKACKSKASSKRPKALGTSWGCD